MKLVWGNIEHIAACCLFMIFLDRTVASTTRRTFFIYEGQSPGEFVGNLNITIKDVVPRPKNFYFNHTTGVVKSIKTLDREKQALYSFTVITLISSPILVNIEVNDINDESPTFSSQNKTVHISERYDVGHIYNLGLQVADKDVGVNSIHNDSVRIVSGNLGGVLKIALKKHPNFYAVSLELAKKLNWSSVKEYHLNLSASDSGSPRKVGFMSLIVIVQDYNDCPPKFSRPNYVADVSESIKPQTVVLNITTSDCDGGKNAEVIYRMNYDSYYDKGRFFSIQQKDRVGYISTHYNLDYETKKIYKLQVIATDKGANPKKSTADITVYVRDENDNSPKFHSFHLFKVFEDAKIKSLVAKVEIHDKDSGQNSKLNVSLAPMDVFSIAEFSRGIYFVSLRTALDYEKIKSYLIIVTATDNGKPPRTTTDAETLVVGDVNDNPPKFEQSVYTHDIAESTIPGTFVLTARATDRDTVSALNITYHILMATHPTWFGINLTSGAIHVTSIIDHETSDKATLVIQAFDGKFTANCTVIFNIIDSNDNAPKFSKSYYVMTVPENSHPGTFVGIVNASDVDLTSRGHISFFLSHPNSKAFNMNNITGNITTVLQLDREQRDMYNFSVIARDEDGLHSRAMITVIVGDVNDNRPFFERNSYTISVYENISVGMDIYKLEAKDHDIGWNAQISYEFISGNDGGTFDLDKSNGQISLLNKLDREKMDKYVLKFRAIDNGGLTSQTLATVKILVKDVNDDPPVFNKEKYSFNLKENGSIGNYVGTVQANSHDEGFGGVISYSIKTLGAQKHFHINYSGAIFTTTKLDHEIRSKYEFLVEAQDHGTPSLFGYVNVTVTVLDINDNVPVWNYNSHCIALNEDMAVRTNFHCFEASDKDSGLNGKVSYSIMSGPRSMFNLNPETGNLSLNTGVDYEQEQLYQLTLNASDAGKPALWSLLKVNICVIDVNDNVPVLHNSSVNVSENLPINALIYTFHAVDKDSGENGKVWYQISSDLTKSSLFRLGMDGNLTLKSPLDRETKDKHEVYVLVGDLGIPINTAPPVKLTVYVLDVNDEIPTFTNRLSFFTTEEKIPGTMIGKVEANDRDLGKNSEIEYSLVNSTDYFVIDSKTGKIHNIVTLDREKISIHYVQVQASDNGNPRQIRRETIRIHVQDINDNHPKFTKFAYNAAVAENVRKGTKIAQVKAVDIDEGKNGEVIYLLSTGNTQGGVEMFQINSTTGFIYIVASLDREIKDFFVLSVVANDKGNPLKDSICRVFVTVLDVNDHKPEFKVKNDTIYISEKTPVGTVVYQTNATDQDIDENGNIIYSIVKVSGEQVFRINEKTGNVILNKTLDYEHTKQYSIRIKASDKARDNPKKSILRLYINILDSNDNGPIFDENPTKRSVFENQPVGTKVGKPVLATDKDSGINSRIVYSITKQSPEAAFNIHPFTAQITTDAELDRENVGKYVLVVEALDQAGDVLQQKSNTVSVEIEVMDENDCRPVFTSPNKSFIMEDEPVNFTASYFIAEDKDLGNASRVTFSLVEGNEHGTFYLDPTWGSLILKKTIDREKVDSYQLKIKASDHGSPPLSSTTTFTLSVVDVNDNDPYFSNYFYKVSVPENENSAHVLKVKATDLDSGALTYSLPPGFADELFIINESTGLISTNSPLDREKQQMYELAVYVQDNGYPLKTDCAAVIINVTDKNDNDPKVLQNFFEVKVPENSPPGYVFSVIAHDADTEINARLNYSIEREDNVGYFEIDRNSGVISTVTPLDREIWPVHNFTIKVQDQGNPSRSSRVDLFVIVLDENDNNPKFSSSEINVLLPGGSHPGAAVVTLTATDDDEDFNTAITYSFNSEEQIPFGLDSTSGLIYTLNYLNASEIDTYKFVVNASDGSKSGARFGSVKVNVFVDNTTGIPLRFTEVLFEVDRESQVKAGVEILQLKLKNDYLKLGDVEYIYEGGQKVLAVGRTKGNVSFTKNPFPGAYLLRVRATLVHDRRMTAVCFVRVRVQDKKKQYPSFLRSSYSATLNENLQTNDPIVTVKPYTAGNVSYEIVNGNEFDAFKIDGNGEITIKNTNALDYERSRSFELDIKGDWGIRITNIAFTKVYITLRNLNDKAPVFRQRVFVSSISESIAKSENRFVTKLYAFNFGDLQMVFTIVSADKEGVFLLNSSTGELFLQKAVLRGERKSYNLTVSVSTGALSSKCTVLVFITDINNNSPKLPRGINFTIFENSPLGSHVGQVNATDKDEYTTITYSFFGNRERNGPFVIDRYTGILRLVDHVDFESKLNLYSFDVFATDQKHEASTKVFVTILDENDHKPVFEKVCYSVRRQEPISANTQLARINATDEDEGDNKRITYNITLNDKIGINPNTGMVFTKKTFIYTMDFIDLIITATDHGFPKLSSEVPFRLQILDQNNIPQFGKAPYEEIIPENIEIGTEVVRIKPLNSDSLAGKKRISFEIHSGDELKMFRIEERSGVIRVRRQLDREHTSIYNLIVIVKDEKSNPFDRIKVMIKIDDVNDNAPVFLRNKYFNDSMYKETIAEDITPPRTVLTVSATDKDSGRNKDIKYSISSGNNGGWFSMVGNKLRLVKSVDRDVIPIHRLSVTASDQGK